MTDIEKARLLLTRFPGRDNCYGAGKGACVKERLTELVVLQHIAGKKRVGRYLLRLDGRIGALAVDLDEDDLNAVMEYCARCEHYGLVTSVERSKSKGYHLWWFFYGLVPARKARLVASYIVEECNLQEDTEIFPRQDFLRPGTYGNYINLPAFGQDVRQGRTVFLNPSDSYKPYRDQWLFLASRPRMTETQLDDIVELNNLHRHTPSQAVKAGEEASTSYEGMGLPCFNKMLREGVDEGMRNETTLRLAAGLYRTRIPKDLGLTMLKEWNKRNRPPMDDAEIERAVSNGYSGLYGHGCLSSLIQRYCEESCPIYGKYSQGNGGRKRR